LFLGGFIFKIFGITLDAFRVGTGALLFLTSVGLVSGNSIRVPQGDSIQSLAVVPMAIPITLGPASIGVLMVYGGEIKTGLGFFLAYLSISAAVICVGLLLFVSNYIQKAIGKNGLVVLSKLTGLILAALSAQMIFMGADGFLQEAIKNALK
uniref:MarC family protein n=1 Tax=uncultured Parasutterella sp. TaxID=1263098 RepID=UPI002594951E